MRRILLFFLCILVLICPVLAESSVPQVQTTASVNADSLCSISTTATVTLDEDVRGVSVLLPEGSRSVNLNGSSVNPHQNRISLDNVTGGHAGVYTVTISYELPGVVTKEQDDLTLRIPLLSGFSYPVERMSFTVTLPGAVDYAPTFSSGYLQESIESQLSYVVKGSVVSGVIATPLKDHETLSMLMTVTEDMFPQKEPLPSTLVFDRAGMLVCIGLALLYWLLSMSAKPVLPTHQAVPPAGVSAGELGCRLTLAPADLTMMVLTWAQLGYLIIQYDEGGRVILHKKMEMGNERSSFENHWFSQLFHRRNRESAASLRYAALCQRAAAVRPPIRELLRPNSGNPVLLRALISLAAAFAGFSMCDGLTENSILWVVLMLLSALVCGVTAWRIQKAVSALHLRRRFPFLVALAYSGVYVLLGLLTGQLPVALGALAMVWIAGLFGAYSGKRTELGRQLASEILGLRRHLTKIPTEELNRILASNPGYFYDMVPYAMALGVDRRFAKRMGTGHLPPCGWFVTSLDTPRSADEWCLLLRQAVAAMDRADHRPIWQRFFLG